MLFRSATLAFHLIPPPSPAFRANRLLALALRDLRSLAATPIQRTRGAWESALYARLSSLPAQAEPLQRAQLLASLSVGSEIIRLRRIGRRLDVSATVETALALLAQGKSALAGEELRYLSDALSTHSRLPPRRAVTLRTQGSISAIRVALSRHAPFFDSMAPP